MAIGSSDEAYLYDQAYLSLAATGVTAIMVALVIGVVLGLDTGDLFAQEAAARAADLKTQGVIQGLGAWNPALGLAGAALLMTAVVVVLQRVLSTIRLRGRTMAATLPALLTPRSN